MLLSNWVLFCLQEKAKFNIMAEKLQRDLNESQAALYEESQKATRLQMELDAHESEVEQLQGKLALYNSDNMSVNSGPDLDGGRLLAWWTLQVLFKITTAEENIYNVGRLVFKVNISLFK